MNNNELTTLVRTLLQSGLASSASEANRMATEMLKTSGRVNEDFSKDQSNNYSVKDYKPVKNFRVTSTGEIVSNYKSFPETPEKLNAAQATQTTEQNNAFLKQQNTQFQQQTQATANQFQQEPNNMSSQTQANNNSMDLNSKIQDLRNTAMGNKSMSPEDYTSMRIQSENSQQQQQPTNNQNSQNDFLTLKNPSDNNSQQPPVQEQEQKPKSRWTEDEQKLREQIDLSKVFNFGK